MAPRARIFIMARNTQRSTEEAEDTVAVDFHLFGILSSAR